MKLIFPVLTLTRGGAQRMLTELANRLTEMGHEVTILLPSDGVVEYEMKCKLIYAKEGELAASDFPAGDVIISNFYTTVEVSQRASEEGKAFMFDWRFVMSLPFYLTIAVLFHRIILHLTYWFYHTGNKELSR